jgi:hypothetical protein
VATRPSSSATVSSVEIGSLVAVEMCVFVDNERALEHIEPFHVWTAETVAKRFHYRAPGVWVLGVRVYRRGSPFVREITPAQAGCKTWVMLDEPLSTSGLAPVLDDEQHAQRMERIDRSLIRER